MIIKPILDLLGHYDVSTIGVLSSTNVFAMAIVSLIKAKHSGLKVKGGTIFIIALASIIGGIIGRNIFNLLINILKNEHVIQTYQVQNASIIFSVGLDLVFYPLFWVLGADL